MWLVPGTITNLTRIWEEPLTHVRVEGTAVLVPLQVAAAAGLQPGLPLGGLDPLTVASRLLSNPWVAGADVRRIFPGSMEVRIRERRPAAWVELADGHRALVDDAQTVLERDPPPGRIGTLGLPSVQALGPDAVSGLRLPDSAVRDGMALARTYLELVPQPSEPIRVDARNPLAWRLFLPGAERELLLPSREAKAALGKFVAVRPALDTAAPGWRRADLRAAGRNGAAWIALTR
jgi:cell division septal protein FtsQ